MTKKRYIPDSDSNLFREAIDKLNPHQADKFDTPDRKRARQQATSVEQAATSKLSTPKTVNQTTELFFARKGLQERVCRKLRRGQFTIDARLDLHGMTEHEAQIAVHYFMAKCHRYDQRHLLVIHGKGKSSENKQSVLKNGVNRWLREDKKVLAFCSAQPKDGGTGAVYVLLKSN